MTRKSRLLRSVLIAIDIAVAAYTKRKKDDVDVSTLELDISSHGVKTRARPPQPVTDYKPMACASPDCHRLVTVHKSYDKKYCPKHY